MKTKTEGGLDYPAKAYLIVEDADSPATWHLRVKDEDGMAVPGLMAAAWKALHGGIRGKTYIGKSKDKAIVRLIALYGLEGLDLPSATKEDSLQDKLQIIRDAFWSQFHSSTTDNSSYLVDVFEDYVIAQMGSIFYRIGYTVSADGAVEYGSEANWTEVEKEYVPVKSDFVVYHGSEVKALGDGKIGGYLISFGDEDNTDVSASKDFFQKDTDFGASKTSIMLYNHGLDKTLGLRKIGTGTLKMDDVGVWIEAQLEMRDKYEKAIYALAEKGKLGLSSGTAPHLVRRKRIGSANKILSWPLGLDASLTPSPAEPRNMAIAGLKSIQVTDLESQLGLETDNETAHETDSTKGKKTMEEDKNKGKTMAPAVGANGDDLKSAVMEALEQQRQVAEAEADRKKEQEEFKISIGELVEKAMKGAPAIGGGGREVGPNIIRKTKLGDDAFKAFSYFIKTGDSSPIHTGEAYVEWQRQQEHEHAIKTDYALLEGTQYQGQEPVPTEVAAVIVEKRNAISVVRAAGATVYPAKSNALVIPIEKGAPQKFGITTIDATNTFTTQTSQPLDKLAGTIYMFTYNVPIDIQLIDDSVFGVEGWLARRIGRGWGLTENQYFLVGTGSGQPQGVVTGATAGTVAASATAVTAAEIIDNYYKLPGEYRDRPTWIMRGATEGAVRKLTSTTFPFVGTGGTQGAVGQGQGMNALPSGTGWLVDPKAIVFNSDEMDALTASKKPILVGNFEAGYAVIERKVLTVLRDPYSSANKGLVQLWWYFREGGGVTDALAFYYMATPSA